MGSKVWGLGSRQGGAEQQASPRCAAGQGATQSYWQPAYACAAVHVLAPECSAAVSRAAAVPVKLGGHVAHGLRV